jgi:hypothetical protein
LIGSRFAPSQWEYFVEGDVAPKDAKYERVRVYIRNYFKPSGKLLKVIENIHLFVGRIRGGLFRLLKSLFWILGEGAFESVEPRVMEMLTDEQTFQYGASIIAAAGCSGKLSAKLRSSFIELLSHDSMVLSDELSDSLGMMFDTGLQLADCEWLCDMLRDATIESTQAKFHIPLGWATLVFRKLGWRAIDFATDYLEQAIVGRLDGEISLLQSGDIADLIGCLTRMDPMVRNKKWLNLVLEKFLVPNETTFFVYLPSLLASQVLEEGVYIEFLKTHFEFVYVTRHDEIGIQYSPYLRTVRGEMFSSVPRFTNLVDCAIKHYKNMNWTARTDLVTSVSNYVVYNTQVTDRSILNRVFDEFLPMALLDEVETVSHLAMEPFFHLLIFSVEDLESWSDEVSKGIYESNDEDILKGCAVMIQIVLKIECPNWVLKIIRALFETYSDRGRLANTIRVVFLVFYTRHQYNGIEAIAAYQNISPPSGFS